MEDFEFYQDDEEEEEAAAEEGSNRVFIYAVAGLGGLFVIGLIVIGVVVLYLMPRMNNVDATNQAIRLTNTAVAATIDSQANGTENLTETPAQTEEPTDSPTTEEPTATNTPNPPTETPTPASISDAGDTEEPTEPAPTPSRRPTSTPKPTNTATDDDDSETPATGFSTLGAGALVLGLLLALVAVRRLRQTTQ